MTQLLDPALVLNHFQADTFEQVVAALAGRLRRARRVRDTFESALLAREQRFPTGLPLGCGVAIPHTDAEHVIEDSVAIATLRCPVPVGDMTGPEGATTPARLVFMLAFRDGAQHIDMLAAMVQSFQDERYLSELTQAATPEATLRLVREKLQL